MSSSITKIKEDILRSVEEEFGLERTDAEKMSEIAENKRLSTYQDILEYIKESSKEGKNYREWPLQHKRNKGELLLFKEILEDHGFRVTLKFRPFRRHSHYFLLIEW